MRIKRTPYCFMKGKDISAPAKTINMGGVTYKLVFNNNAARIAEDVYEEVYHKDVGYMVILQELTVMKHRALQALVYGAMVAGGAEMSWEDFDRDFKYDALSGIREIIKSGILESLPEDDGKEKN